MKVHLVDGTFELFRAYYATPPQYTENGKPVGAVRGLLASTISLLKTPDVTHLAFSFDHVIESFRNQLFDGYKTGEGMDPELYSQFQLAEDAIHALGIPVWSMVKFEADDGLASGAKKYSRSSSVKQVILCTPDKDLAQCVRGNKVVMWDRVRKKKYNEKAVKEKFGVAPASIPDLLALTGDTADGVPGIPKWGMKSASTLLSQYHFLKKIPLDEKDWTVRVRGASGLAKTLRENWDHALLYRKLTMLREDVPIRESLSELKWKKPSLKKVTEFSKKIEAAWVPQRVLAIPDK